MEPELIAELFKRHFTPMGLEIANRIIGDGTKRKDLEEIIPEHLYTDKESYASHVKFLNIEGLDETTDEVCRILRISRNQYYIEKGEEDHIEISDNGLITRSWKRLYTCEENPVTLYLLLPNLILDNPSYINTLVKHFGAVPDKESIWFPHVFMMKDNMYDEDGEVKVHTAALMLEYKLAKEK